MRRRQLPGRVPAAGLSRDARAPRDRAPVIRGVRTVSRQGVRKEEIAHRLEHPRQTVDLLHIRTLIVQGPEHIVPPGEKRNQAARGAEGRTPLHGLLEDRRFPIRFRKEMTLPMLSTSEIIH